MIILVHPFICLTIHPPIHPLIHIYFCSLISVSDEISYNRFCYSNKQLQKLSGLTQQIIIYHLHTSNMCQQTDSIHLRYSEIQVGKSFILACASKIPALFGKVGVNRFLKFPPENDIFHIHICHWSKQVI